MKRRTKTLFAIAIFAILMGLAAMFAAQLVIFENPTALLAVNILGAAAFLLGVALFCMTALRRASLDRRLRVEESDERNIAVRGKAASATCAVSVISQIVAMCVFIALDSAVGVCVMAFTLMAFLVGQVVSICYYSKKM
jgi:uncharacterized membrane protein